MKTFEDELLLDRNNLVIDKQGNATADILDAELDVLKCEFNGDCCVKIDTTDYTHITLTEDNLLTILLLLDKEKEYRNNTNQLN